MLVTHGSIRFYKDTDYPIYVSKYHHDTYVPPHDHKYYEFVYVESGFSAHRLNGSISVLFPGCVFGMKPGDVHEYFHVRKAVIYNCLFLREAIAEHLDYLANLHGLKEIFTDRITSGSFMARLYGTKMFEATALLKKMCHETEKRLPGWELKLKAELLDFLISLSRVAGREANPARNTEYTGAAKLTVILKHIEENYMKPLTIKELSENFDMNADHFCRQFKKMCGITPSEYIQNLRLAKALELLVSTSASVSEVSSIVGIEDPNYFTRLFKKTVGITPTEARKMPTEFT